MHIRKANAQDRDAILGIILPIIRDGSTYALAPDMSEEEALAYWMAPAKHTLVAVHEGQVVGTYYLTANQAGGGAHVCNCGFMVSPDAAGQGVARAMCKHALSFAKEAGFLAMQFNFVVSTNTRAVRLWENLGFDTVGRLPCAFHHPSEGFVDALVMHRVL